MIAGRRWVEPLAAFGTWMVGAMVFFRDQLFSGFDTLLGDRGDARLQVFLHEHWWRTLHGDEPWRTPPMFHPVSGVLGYSDTNLLNTVLYAPFRLAGAEPFLATQLTLIGLSAIGFAAMYLVLRRHVGTGPAVACPLSAAASFSNNLFVDSGHPQLFAAAYVPVVLLLALESRRASSTRAAVLWALAAGVLLGLLLTSAFYIGWFAVLAGACWAAVAAVLHAAHHGWRALLATCRAHGRRLAAFAAGSALGLVPFVAVYLPVRRQFGGRTFAEVANLQPRPGDLFNVGGDHLLWGWALRAVHDDDPRLGALHRAVAVTPVLAIAVAACGVGLARAWAARRTEARAAAGVAACVTAVLLAVLPVHFGPLDPWAAVYRVLPGGSVIRVPGRLGIVTVIVACLGVALYAALPARDARRRWWPAATVALSVLIAVEQVNGATAFRHYDRDAELAMLDAVPAPPAECSSFFVVDPTRTPYDGVSIDAMLIALLVGIPTVNGYSGQTPPGWDLRPWLDGYPQMLAGWAAGQRLTPGLCSLDLATGEWLLGLPQPASGP